MKPRLATPLVAFAVWCLSFAAPPCRADFILTLSAPGTDLNSLGPGQTVTFNVTLSGVTAADIIDLLGVDVRLPASIFAVPSVPIAGAIVPDVGGFLFASGTIGSERFATGLYDDLIVPSAPITSDGLFYSFTASVIGVGTGTVQFDPSSAVVIGTQGLTLDPNPPAGLGVLSTPEPSSLLLATIASAGLVLFRRRFAATS